MYRKQKFSIHYRIEKWFFEDSKKDAKKALIMLCEGLTFIAMLSILFLIPALFHQKNSAFFLIFSS